ncbi:MAG: DMT family transporter [Archaeoglobus sp.]|nr:DMT family transporter [Archaeoglobus sp.]
MIGILFALISSILWGINGIFLRKGLEGEDVVSATFTVIFIVTCLTFFFSLGGVAEVDLPLQKVVMLMLAGIISYFIARVITYFSVTAIGSSRAFSGTSTRIMFSAFFGVFLLHEALNELILSGTILMIIGLYIFSTEKIDKFGIYISVLSGFLYGLASLFIKEGLLGSIFFSVFLASISGLVMLGIFAAFKGKLKLIRNKYLAISATSLAFGNISYYFALSIAPLTIAVPISNLYPLVTTVLSYFFIQKLEFVQLKTFVGSFLAVLGSILISIGK